MLWLKIVADKEEKEKYLVIDVRSAEDYAKGTYQICPQHASRYL